MLSIDEAIAHAREVSSRKFDDRVHCIRCAEEHEQLAEWLEELKALREEKSEFLILAKDNYEMGMESGYNKALDDFVTIIKERVGMDWEWDFYFIEEIAEKLKKGDKE